MPKQYVSFAEAVKRLGIVSYVTAWRRVKKGWKVEEAISIPAFQSPTTQFLAGARFGKLVLICKEESNSRRDARWRCQCDCGLQTVVLKKNLKGGYTRSCGCLRRTIASLRRKES